MELRILIDGYYLSKPRGMGRYVREYLFALSEYGDADINITVIVPRSMHVKHRVASDRLTYVEGKSLPFPLWEQWEIPKACRRLKPTLLHSPYNTLPLLHIRWRGQVVSMLDVMFFDPTVGQGVYQRIGNAYRRWISLLARHGRQTIVTISEQSAIDISRVLGQRAQPIHIPVGLFALTPTHNESPIPGPYILHVGGISPHKNSKRCIQAFLAGAPSAWSLVVAGMPGDCDLARTYAGKRVIFPGWLSDPELATYYRHAEILLFCSLREGYGLPIVEGFAYGNAVITSRHDPMREIAGNATLLVDPEQTAEIMDAIREVTENDSLRQDLKRRSRKRYTEIDGRHCAELVQNVYRQVAEQIS